MSEEHVMNEEEFFISETEKHINRVRELLSLGVIEILKRAANHDRTKIESPEERDVFVKFTPKLKDCTYGSEEYSSFLKEMQSGLDFHYKSNRHHPEHHANGIRDMNLFDIMELFFDWRAATERHADGDIMKSIEHNQKRFHYSDDLKNILQNTVKWLEEESGL